jgi:hypothetical protein
MSMHGFTGRRVRRWTARFILACAACVEAACTPAFAADANPAAALRARVAAHGNNLTSSPFNRPLMLDSVESSSTVRGDVFALVDYPFADINAVFNGPARWCDVLILHINTKFCATAGNAAGTVLTLNIGKKTDEPLRETTRVDFDFTVATATPDYLAVQLRADRGPLSTSDYRILLEAASAEGGKTILHLTYSYAYGATGRLAMQVYLATAGRGKVGFTVTGRQSDGKPDYIGGVRGIVERNTMRYFLAIDSYLSAPGRFETRAQNWYDATENYPRQLHDVERTAYLEMKRREYQRQQAALQ